MTDLRDETNWETNEDESDAPRQLPEGEDYYLENGLMVFTAAFLKRRGYCCESGCRHCPYGFMKTDKDEDEKRETQLSRRGQSL